jgi:dTDP-L-rhamnose 4-epimerase
VLDHRSLGVHEENAIRPEYLHPDVERIVACRMSIHGEGRYRNNEGEIVRNGDRDVQQLREGRSELTDEHGEVLTPMPTPETQTPSLASIDAVGQSEHLNGIAR